MVALCHQGDRVLHSQFHLQQPHPPPSILQRMAFGMLAPRQSLCQEAQSVVPALGDHALGTAAGRQWCILRHLAPKNKPRAVTFLSGLGGKQSCSSETTSIICQVIQSSALHPPPPPQYT